jgi:predicted MPP superfamily phosphohydrolase
MFPSDAVQAIPAVVVLAVGVGWTRRSSHHHAELAATALVAFGLIAWPLVTSAFDADPDGFWVARMWCWGLFVWGPAWMAGVAFRRYRSRARWGAAAFGGAAVALWLIAADAFLIEPHALTEQRYTLTSSKVSRPIRIAIVADWQTDDLSAYDIEVARRILDLAPDAIVFPGDYVQRADDREYDRVAGDYHRLMREADFAPPLGSYAVMGNMEVDRQGRWMDLFRDTRVQATETTRSWTAGELTFTALSFEDSFNPKLSVPAAAGFQIVVGHGPNFFLGESAADLMIAGHTHGGQVQIPGFGPILTLSSVPRAWAAGGMFSLPSGPIGVVSRGIGLERGFAPRLRFWCRPQLVFIDIFPSNPA